MNIDICTQRLAANGEAIRNLLAGVGLDQARWRPAPDKWSILEVVNHLYDEEREDFRARIDHVLHRADVVSWPPIDPQGWPESRRYNERDLGESLDNFLGERRNSITWLNGLSAPDWNLQYIHPAFGPIRAGDLLASWLAHDLLHVRQLGRLHYQYLSVAMEGWDIAYAGELS